MSSWLLLGIGLGVYALSCLFPLWASKVKKTWAKGYLATSDALLTVAAVILTGEGVGHGVWGVLFVILVYVGSSAVFGSVVDDDWDPYGSRAKARAKREAKKSREERRSTGKN